MLLEQSYEFQTTYGMKLKIFYQMKSQVTLKADQLFHTEKYLMVSCLSLELDVSGKCYPKNMGLVLPVI